MVGYSAQQLVIYVEQCFVISETMTMVGYSAQQLVIYVDQCFVISE